jgi:hypothetical protein
MKTVRLENEVVIFEIVFGMVYGWLYKGFQKNPPYTSSDYLSLELFYFHIYFNIAKFWYTFGCSPLQCHHKIGKKKRKTLHGPCVFYTFI